MTKKKTVVSIEPDKYYSIPQIAVALWYTNRMGVVYLIKQGKIPAKYMGMKKQTVSYQKQMILGQYVFDVLQNK